MIDGWNIYAATRERFDDVLGIDHSHTLSLEGIRGTKLLGGGDLLNFTRRIKAWTAMGV